MKKTSQITQQWQSNATQDEWKRMIKVAWYYANTLLKEAPEWTTPCLLRKAACSFLKSTQLLWRCECILWIFFFPFQDVANPIAKFNGDMVKKWDGLLQLFMLLVFCFSFLLKPASWKNVNIYVRPFRGERRTDSQVPIDLPWNVRELHKFS